MVSGRLRLTFKPNLFKTLPVVFDEKLAVGVVGRTGQTGHALFLCTLRTERVRTVESGCSVFHAAWPDTFPEIVTNQRCSITVHGHPNG